MNKNWMFLCQSSCIQLGLHPTQWLHECRKKQKETKHKEIEQNKKNFDVDINDVISLVKIWVKSFMHLLTKHKERNTRTKGKFDVAIAIHYVTK